MDSGPTENVSSAERVAERLERLRLAFGLKKVEMARRLRMGQSTWSNWMRGRDGPTRLGVVMAIRVCEEFGVTLDYLYRGKLDGGSSPARRSHQAGSQGRGLISGKLPAN